MARFANFDISITMLNLNLYFFSLDVMYYSYYFLLPREQFSLIVVWWCIVHSPLARGLYLTRQHYTKKGSLMRRQ